MICHKRRILALYMHTSWTPAEGLSCCLILQPVWVQSKALDHSAELFDSADKDQDDKLTLAELRLVLGQASKRYSHLEEHARFLEA